MVRGTLRGEVIESLGPNWRRGESIAPEGRNESFGCLDMANWSGVRCFKHEIIVADST